MVVGSRGACRAEEGCPWQERGLLLGHLSLGWLGEAKRRLGPCWDFQRQAYGRTSEVLAVGGERGRGTQSWQWVPIFPLLHQPLIRSLALGITAHCWHRCLLSPGGHLIVVVVPYTSPSHSEGSLAS